MPGVCISWEVYSRSMCNVSNCGKRGLLELSSRWSGRVTPVVHESNYGECHRHSLITVCPLLLLLRFLLSQVLWEVEFLRFERSLMELIVS